MEPTIIDGWTLYEHPAFSNEVKQLEAEVAKLRKKDPYGYKKKTPTKKLAAITKLISVTIPNDPSAPEFRQGRTLGPNNKHWFRAKFFQQYRLFFRFSIKEKVIIYGWVNNDNSKRAYGSKTDAYATFKKRLSQGNPPSDWDELLAACKES